MSTGSVRRVVRNACTYFPVAATALFIAMAQPEAGAARELLIAGIARLDTLRGSASDDEIRGTPGNDLLDGQAGSDRLFGFDGKDILNGGAGRDWLDGGLGDDVLEGGDDNDVLAGGDGNDYLFGEDGNDVLEGGDGSDALDGGEGDNRLDGGLGDDMLMGGTGDDHLLGGPGNDHLEGAEGADILEGGEGNDFLDGGEGDNILRGGAGADTLFGDEEDDHLDGGVDDDLIWGDDGNDVLRGAAGNDLLTGGDGTDDLDGGAGNDVLNGDDNNDVLLGAAGIDSLFGGANNDRIDGGPGNDLLRGDDGDDMLDGDAGDDYLIGGRGTDVQNSGPQNDVILLRAGDVDSARIELIDGGTNPGPREEADTLLLSGFTDAHVRRVQTADGTRIEIVDPITGGTYIVTRVETILFVQVIPHIASAGPSVLQVFNIANAEASGTLRFIGADGRPLATVVGSDSARPTAPFRLASRSVADLNIRPAGTGTVWLYSDQPVGGVLRTTLAEDTPGVVPIAPLFEEFILPAAMDRRNGSTFGFAATTGFNSAIKVYLYSQTGGELDESVIDLSPRGQVTRFLNDLFPKFDAFEGRAIVRGGPFAGMSLLVASGRLSAAPPVVWPGSGPTLVPSVVSGGGNSTTFRIYGLGIQNDTVRNGKIAFFDNQGRPVAVAVDGAGSVTEAPFAFAPQRMAVITTSARGAPVEASAVITTGTGRIVTSVTASLGGARTISTIANRGHTRFIAAARRNEAEQLTTSIAVSAGTVAATVDLVLRGPDGQRITGGDARVTLTPNARAVQSIEQMFPRAQLANFRGTVELTASGMIGLTVTETARTTATAMPVTVLQ